MAEDDRPYKIPESRMWEFRSLIGDLARKAEKLGLPSITFKVVEQKVEKRRRVDENGVERGTVDVVINYVEVQGTAPVINGWRLVGTLVHTGEGNFALPVAGFALPERFRGVPPQCDHCQVDRNRRDTYVVRHDEAREGVGGAETAEGGRASSPEHKQVGSSCLKDFLGHKDPHAVAALCERMVWFHGKALEFDEDWRSDRHHGEEAAPLDSFLVVLAKIVRRDGFVSGKEAYERGGQSTGKKVWFEMTVPPETEREREERGRATDDDKKLGAEMAAWAAQEFAEKEPGSDFEHNLRLTVRLGLVVERTANIAAAIHTLFQKARRAKAEDRWAGVVSEFIGAPGERLDMALTCVGVFQHESQQYGITNITRFRDARGNVLVWFQSGSQSYRGWGRDPEKKAKEALEPGREYRIRATVKRHEERAVNGGPAEKQTIITRAAVVPEGALAEEAKPRKPRKKKAEAPSAQVMAAAAATEAHALSVQARHQVIEWPRKPVNTTTLIPGAWVCGGCGSRSDVPRTDWNARSPRGIPMRLCADCVAVSPPSAPR